MTRSTVHRIVHRVTEEVVAISHKVIHLPKTPADLAVVTRGFARHRAFRKAALAIDRCHVRIKPPSGNDDQCYKNRKLFPSIILQAVCDHQGRFIDTYVGWPGSVHDSRVLCHSPLYRVALYPPLGHFILFCHYKVWQPTALHPPFQGALHYKVCLWDDEDQVPGHLPASAGGAPHLCTSLKKSLNKY